MKFLIIECHPYENSFQAGAAKAIAEKLAAKGHEARKINLVDDGFDPVMKAEDLRLWGSGQYSDPKVKQYQEAIQEADYLVFPIPIWWGTMPAILKGFCDKVLLPGWAYTYNEAGEMVGLLTKQKGIVITTMQTPCDVFNGYFGNPMEGAFIKDTLQVCGVAVEKQFQFDQIVTGGRPHAEEKMSELMKYFDSFL